MIFVSEPAASPGVGGGAELGGEAGARAERAACVRATCDYLAKEKAQDVLVAQGLPEAGERWTAEALRDAGFTTVGTLSYMRRAIGDRTGGPAGPTVWPEGVEVVALSKLDPSLWDATLVSALDRTYVDTLDCPELCGMRTTPDILASHRATGEFDPSLWWVFLVRGEAHGCLLLTRCPEQRSLELVYLGLSPLLRGKGLSGAALWMGIQAARADCVGWNVACAVDQRNAPALKVYGRLGFRTFSERTAMVRVVGMPTKQA
jgi:GNAT superfamily N-acetyltransferase